MEDEIAHKTTLLKRGTGKNHYLVQSTDPVVNRKMRRRSDFYPYSWSINSSLRVFSTGSSTPQSARRTLSRLTGVPVSEFIFDALTGDYTAITYTIVTSKMGTETK